MADPTEKKFRTKSGFGIPETLFITFLVLAMLGVAWVGRMAYLEGKKGETTKRNGEAWAKWLTQAGLDRGKAGYEPSECATGFLPVVVSAAPNEAAVETFSEAYVAPSPATTSAPVLNVPPVARKWGPCLNALIAQNGPMANYLNPFTQKPITVVPKCDMADRSLAGAMSLEKTVPTPPGSAVPLISSPLAESDSIESKMQIRITMCDKGAYPIRIAELEF